ncbi:hypothetical protein Bca4012_022057 [Brassica carinata]
MQLLGFPKESVLGRRKDCLQASLRPLPLDQAACRDDGQRKKSKSIKKEELLLGVTTCGHGFFGAYGNVPIHHNHIRSPCPPPRIRPGVLVVNVDAAWDAKTGRCGIGAIYSGEAPVYLPLISEAHSHVSSAIMAEAIAVHRAVSSAVGSNVRSLAVLSDSLPLINLLKTDGYQPELFGIMFDIYRFIPLFDVISFNFISRNFNSEADLVAKSELALSVMNSPLGD